MSLETAGRKGRGVTLVTGLDLPEAAIEDLGRELRTVCGTGGTVREKVVEVQGDHRDRVMAELERRGLRPRRL